MLRNAMAALAMMALFSGYASPAAFPSSPSNGTAPSPTTTSVTPSEITDVQALSLPVVERGFPDWVSDHWHMAECIGAHFFHDRSKEEQCKNETTMQGVQMIQDIIDQGALPLKMMCDSYAHNQHIQIAPDITHGKGKPDPAVASQVANGDYSNIVDDKTDGN